MRSLIFNLFLYAYTFFCALVCYCLSKCVSRTVLWRAINIWGRGILWGLRVILDARVEVRGREYLDPSRPQVIVSKHQSELDIIMLAAMFQNISAVAMAELERLPFFGPVMKKLDIVTVAVDSGPQGRTEQVVAGARRMRDEGRSMMIYPEGELMQLGAKARYRSGVWHIYNAMGVEAVPVAVSLGIIWPRRDWHKNAHTVAVMEFMPPIPPGMAFEPFMREIEQRIESQTMALIAEHATPSVLAEARARQEQKEDAA